MRILHTMLRVGDLQRSIDFYTSVLGMKLLRTTDRPEQKYTLAFVGYGDESEQRRARAHVQLRRRPVRSRHRLRPRRDRGRRRGGGVRRRCAPRAARSRARPGPVKGGTTVIAFVQDPDGYKIELIERRNGARVHAASAGRQPARSSSRRSCANTSAPWPWPTYSRSRPCGSKMNVPAEWSIV